MKKNVLGIFMRECSFSDYKITCFQTDAATLSVRRAAVPWWRPPIAVVQYCPIWVWLLPLSLLLCVSCLVIPFPPLIGVCV